jgi:hypothetical protein
MNAYAACRDEVKIVLCRLVGGDLAKRGHHLQTVSPFRSDGYGFLV